MKLLGRIALVLAILASVGALYFANKLGVIRDGLKEDKARLINEKALLTKDLTDTRTTLKGKEADLEKTKGDLDAKVGELENTKRELDKKKADVETANSQLAQCSTEKDKAKSEKESIQREFSQFKDDVTSKVGTNLDVIVELRKEVTTRKDEATILGDQLLAMTAANKICKEELAKSLITPPNLRGKIGAVNPHWGFVVLNLGRVQNVQTNSHFIVYRNEKLVAKVKVKTVLETTSVAEVLPEFAKAEVQVGDTAVH